MSVLLIAEHDNKELRPFTFNAVTAASKIDSDLHVLVAGHNCADVAKAVSEISLVKKVLQVEAEHYENFLPENFAEADGEFLHLHAALARDEIVAPLVHKDRRAKE